MILQSPFSSLPTKILKPIALLGIASLLTAGLVAGNSSSALANGTCALTGDGTSATPYLVATAEDLAKVGVGDCALSAHYQQTANITLPAPVAPALTNHTSIGDANSPFTGTFDGTGKTITGMKVMGDGQIGLFGVTFEATLDDINLVNASVTSENESAATLGSIVGVMRRGTLVDSSVSGDSEVIGRQGIGGMVGYLNGGSIQDGTVSGSFTIQASSFGAGGIVGFADSRNGNTQVPSIINSSVIGSEGSIRAVERGDAGGIIGYTSGAEVIDSRVSGELEVSAGSWSVGGLAGSIYEDATASVVRNSTVGSGVTVIGKVDASEADNVGGFVGYSDAGIITNSYSFASVNGPNVVGGFVGHNDGGTITNSYSAGGVQGPTATTGGFVGDNDFGTITNSFWDTDTSAISTSDGGTGKTTADMQTLATFSNASWSITSASAFGFDRTGSNLIWGIGASLNCGYPFLYWQTEPSVSCGPVPTISGVRAFRTSTAAAFDFESNVAGTYFFLVYEAADPTPNAQTIITQGTAVAKGSGRAFGGDDQSAGITGLADDNPYKVYLVVRDGANANNISAVTAFDFTRSAAGATPPPSSGSSGSTVTAPATSEAIKKVTRLSKLSGSRSALTKKARSDVRASVRSMTTVTSAVCTGYVSNPRVASFTKKQARERAVRACNIVKRLQPAAEVRTRVVVVKDAKLPRLRSVRVALTGR